MGPPLINGGIVTIRGRVERIFEASMGPPLINGGIGPLAKPFGRHDLRRLLRAPIVERQSKGIERASRTAFARVFLTKIVLSSDRRVSRSTYPLAPVISFQSRDSLAVLQ